MVPGIVEDRRGIVEGPGKDTLGFVYPLPFCLEYAKVAVP